MKIFPKNVRAASISLAKVQEKKIKPFAGGAGYLHMQLTVQKAGGYGHLAVVPEDLVASLGGEKRVICTIDGHALHLAINRVHAIGYYIYLGKSTLKKLDLEAGMSFEAEFRVDDTPYQCEMPEEFEEVLLTDPEADQIFHSLTPGNQRSLIFMVSRVKSIDKRIEKALKITGGLKRGLTKPQEVLKW